MRPKFTLLAVVLGLWSAATAPAVFASEPAQVLVPDGPYFPNTFGASVVVSGETLVVGFSHTGPSPLRIDEPADTVRAHVFEKFGGLWTETQMIEEPFEVAGSEFSETSLTIEGDWLAIGYGDGRHGGMNCGTVHMYTRSGGTWSKTQVLVPPQPCTNATRFGRGIAMSANRLAVIDVSSIHIFEVDGTTWSETEIISTEGYLNDIDLSDSRLGVVWRDDPGSSNPEFGLYVYNHTAMGWDGPTVLQPNDADTVACMTVAFDGARAAFGCQGANGGTGAVSVFEVSGGIWAETATLVPPNETWNGYGFGDALDVKGDSILVGAPYWEDDTGYPLGAVYHFSIVEGEWIMTDSSVGEATVNDGLPTTSAHGWSVTIEGNEFIVGDPYYDRDGRVSVFRMPTGRFSDDDGSIFEADIDWLAGEGITKGCNPPDNTMFCPDASVIRGQMAAFLVRALGLTDTLDDPFVDDDDSIFEADIERLAAAGITKGCNPPANDRFCPDAQVSREQMAAFLVRALKYSDDGGGDLFIDDDDSIFEADIDRLATAGVTKGCNPPSNTKFCPTNSVTRGQMAAFLHRALG